MSRKKKRRRAHRQKAASPPGLLHAGAEAQPSRFHLLRFDAKTVDESRPEKLELDPLKEVKGVLWLDVEGLADVDTLQALGNAFQWHRLALEDIFYTQRPKSEFYDDHMIICLPMLADDQGEVEQLRILVGPHYVMTFQDGRPGDSLEPVRLRLRENKGLIRNRGAGYLAYALVDAVVDAYFPLVDDWDAKLAELEARVSSDLGADTVIDIRELRHRGTRLRRTLRQLRDGLGSLLNRDSKLVKEELPYFRDCYDHLIELLEALESQREWATELLEQYHTNLNQRTNEAMQTLTVIATVFIPLSFIAGLYGMNFDSSVSPWNMPELRWRWGYPFVLLFMTTVGGGLGLYFYRKGWLAK